jgi:hypothetical protein
LTPDVVFEKNIQNALMAATQSNELKLEVKNVKEIGF